MINPAPIPSELSLNAGGSRRTKDLPRNLLNSFKNRSKVEEQRRENTCFLKRIFARIRGSLERSWRRFAGVVGAVPSGDFDAPELAVNFA